MKKLCSIIFFLSFSSIFAQLNLVAGLDSNNVRKAMSVDDNGSPIIVERENTTTIVDLYLSQKLDSIGLNNDVLLLADTVTVDSGHSIIVGNWLEIWENGAWYQGEVEAVSTNLITLGVPFDFQFTTESIVRVVNVDMNANGSVTNVKFSLAPELNNIFHITRTIIVMTHTGAADDGLFGDQTALTNGVLYGFESDVIDKYLFVVKTNGEYRNRTYDLTYSDKAPAGENGTAARRTFGGVEKNGSIIEVDPAINAEIVTYIRDDLTGLSSMRQVVQGHLSEFK